jgi:predicted dehydrogenase
MAEFGILGSGFGMYGYLPALLNSGHEVTTLSEYKAKLELRPELAKFIDQVTFTSEQEILDNCENLVIAKDPRSQYQLLSKNQFQCRRLFLEKPLAPSISQHKEMLKVLESQNINFSLGYLFQFTPWWKRIASDILLGHSLEVEIDWRLSIPQGWKNSHQDGGGMVAFYAIHFAPILNFPGISIDHLFSIESNKLSFVLTNYDDIKLHIRLEYADKSAFSIFSMDTLNQKTLLYAGDSPFGAKPSFGKVDPRIPFLEEYIAEVFSENDHTADRLKLEKLTLGFRTSFEH